MVMEWATKQTFFFFFALEFDILLKWPIDYRVPLIQNQTKTSSVLIIIPVLNKSSYNTEMSFVSSGLVMWNTHPTASSWPLSVLCLTPAKRSLATFFYRKKDSNEILCT